MFEKPRKLLVVYKEKDELALNQLRKLIDTKDDEDDGSTIGTKDGSVKIISWNEKTWLDNKKAGNTGDLDDKILFLGDIKGVEKLIPTLDKKDCGHGVYYGFSGKQAVVMVDGMNLASPKKIEDYGAFLKDLKRVCDVEAINNMLLNELGDTSPKGKFLIAALSGAAGIGIGISKVISLNKICRIQQLIYGIAKLYYDDLDDFMSR